MTADVIVPWRAGCPYRELVWAWVRPRIERFGWPVTVAEHGDGPWIKASTVMPAIEASNADVVVVHDADCLAPALPAAVCAVQSGAPWAMPHLLVHRLTRVATAEVLAGAPVEDQPVEQPPYAGVMSGGVIVLRRDVALDTPMDARFQGWGGEDHSWGYALAALHGDPWRGTDPLYHLWHPPADRIDRFNGSYPSQALHRRYFAARNDRPAMRALVEDGRRQWPSKSSSTATP